MITCPKCGFEQPDDQFCAKCGIMMQGFVPESPGLTKRITASPGLLIVVGIAFAAGLAFYFAKQQGGDDSVFPPATQENAAHVTTTPTAAAIPPQADAEESPPTQAVAQSTASKAVAPAPAPVAPAAPAPTKRDAHEQVAAGDASLSQTSQEDRQNEIPARVEYALVTSDVLERINHEGDKPLMQGRYALTTIPRFKVFRDMISRDQGFRSQGSDQNKLSMGQPTVFFKGGRHPKLTENLGIYVEVTPQKGSNRSVDYLLQIKRNLLDVSPTGEPALASSNMTETVSLLPGAGIAVSGILPARPIPPGEEENLKMPILKILTMPEYQRNELELILLFSPDPGPSL